MSKLSCDFCGVSVVKPPRSEADPNGVLTPMSAYDDWLESIGWHFKGGRSYCWNHPQDI